MIFLFIFLSIFNKDIEHKIEFNDNKLLNEKLFHYEKDIKTNKKNKNKISCKLAIELQDLNYFRESSKYLKYCKRLGRKYKELYDFIDIRNKFYTNNSKVIFKINYFIKKYKNSIFLNEIKRYKLRYYFKNKKYKLAYYGYLKYKNKNTISHEKLIFINYILRYSFFKIAKKDDKFIATLDVLQDKKFYLKGTIKLYKNKLKKYKTKDIKNIIKLYNKNKKYQKISKLLYLTRIYLPNLFKDIINEQEIKKILEMENTYLNYQINIYHFYKRSWDFNKKEAFLNNLLELTKKEQGIKDILYQKLLLYKKYKKVYKRIKTYKQMLTLKQSRRIQSYYYLKIGIYLLELKRNKEGIEYLNLLIKKFNRWYKGYSSALFVLFNIYRNKYLGEKDEKKKEIDFKLLNYIEKKMEKTYLRQISYYYKYKDKRINDKEKNKIIKYFNLRPYNFYSIMINKKTIKQKNSWKKWRDLTRYQKIPDFSKNIEKKISIKYSVYKIIKIFKKYKNLFPEINLIQNLQYLGETHLLEKLMIDFYNKLYKLYKIRNKKNINQNKKVLIEALKDIKKSYYYHFLNYFISINNIQYAYLLMHRHFGYLKNDEFYKYYYFPIPYCKIINTEAKIFDINPLIIISIMETESIFNPNAYSSAGAIGLMQIMPATGRAIAKELNMKKYDLYLPQYNIKFGAYYLSELLKRFHYQLPFSAASYNGGPHNMERWLKNSKYKNLEIDEMIEKIGFRESRSYAKKIIRLFSSYRKLYFDIETIIPINVKFDDKKGIGF